MNIIGKKEFKKLKKSDTIVVYGCGYSINDLTVNEKDHLSKFDSVGFNWFIKAKIPTTFYLLREQGTKAFATRGETQSVLVSMLNKHNPDTCLIADDLRSSASRWKRINAYALKVVNNRFIQKGIVVEEVFAKNRFEEFKEKLGKRGRRCSVLVDKMLEYDIFTDGIIYDFCTMTCAMHIVANLDYDKIIFVGVDLYDHRYFWLPKDALRAITQIMGRQLNSKHHVAKFTCELAKVYMKKTGKELYTFNPKSLLKDFIPVYDKSQE